MGEPARRRILFLFGPHPGLWHDIILDGERRGEGWDGWVPAAEANELCRAGHAVTFPDDWPQLPAPAADGEPVVEYISRAMAGHPLIHAISKLHSRITAPTVSGPFRPASMTCAWWQAIPARRPLPAPRRLSGRQYFMGRTRPASELPPPDLRLQMLQYQCWRWAMRILVEMCEQLQKPDGYLAAAGVDTSSRNQEPEPIVQGLWRHDDMLLDIRRTFELRPMRRRGRPPNPNLPTYKHLTLHPRAMTRAASNLSDSTSAPTAVRRPTYPKGRLEAWYKARVEEWSDPRTPSLTNDWEAAKPEFPGITRPVVEDLRRRLAPTHWTAKGRPKSRSK